MSMIQSYITKKNTLNYDCRFINNNIMILSNKCIILLFDMITREYIRSYDFSSNFMNSNNAYIEKVTVSLDEKTCYIMFNDDSVSRLYCTDIYNKNYYSYQCYQEAKEIVHLSGNTNFITQVCLITNYKFEYNKIYNYQINQIKVNQ
jgi:hypothetical protein